MKHRIESMADHPDLVNTISRWHWDEWGHLDPDGSLESWTAGLGERIRRDGIPTTLLALQDREPIGSVTLVEHDMDTRMDLTPWLAGLYVLPDHRRHGIGSDLVAQAVQLASQVGVERLYLYTHQAQSLYERLGWEELAQEDYEGRSVTIMAIRP